MKRLNMIAAVGAQDRVIGRDNQLPWSQYLVPDLQRFKRLTMGCVLLVGRNTWFSFPPKMRPLPGRITFIVSTTLTPADVPEGVLICPTLDDAIVLATSLYPKLEGFIIGGQRMYEEGMAYADRLEITEVGEKPPGNVFFPDYSAFSKVIEETVETYEGIELKYRTLERP